MEWCQIMIYFFFYIFIWINNIISTWWFEFDFSAIEIDARLQTTISNGNLLLFSNIPGILSATKLVNSFASSKVIVFKYNFWNFWKVTRFENAIRNKNLWYRLVPMTTFMIFALFCFNYRGTREPHTVKVPYSMTHEPTYINMYNIISNKGG